MAAADAPANYLDEHADFFELFNDNDSENEFEGFDDDEVHENEEENVENRDLEWESGDRIPPALPFSTEARLLQDVEDKTSPIDYLKLFVNDATYEQIATETNRYAEQYLQDKVLSAKSRFRKWVATTANEIRVFMALILAMGLISQLDVTDYWTTNPVTNTPFFPASMARDRFLLILTFLHLNDNTHYIPRGRENYDPLFKLGNIFKQIVSSFGNAYYPHQQLALDEGMVPWRGNLSFRVYNPDKPTKYGIKAYMICDATNGYCSRFKLYTGKPSTPPSQNGATYDLTMDLLRGYFGRGHILYCDNYYSSPQLFLDLWTLGFGATGTVRSNRKGVPQLIKDMTVPRKGDIAVANCGILSITKYHDSKVVLMLTTVSSSEFIGIGKRDKTTGDEIRRPKLVTEYNKMKGGVDRTDQMVSYGRVLIKTLKWWKKVFFHVFSLATLNAYILYKESTVERTPMLQRIFRRKLISQLIERSNITRKVPGRPSSMQLTRLSGRHFPKKMSNNGRTLSRQCIVCNPAERELLSAVGEKRKHPGRESSYKCGQCDVTLCIDPCFELYHTKQEYILSYKRWKRALEE